MPRRPGRNKCCRIFVDNIKMGLDERVYEHVILSGGSIRYKVSLLLVALKSHCRYHSGLDPPPIATQLKH
jgi:hypothetical protein